MFQGAIFSSQLTNFLIISEGKRLAFYSFIPVSPWKSGETSRVAGLPGISGYVSVEGQS